MADHPNVFKCNNPRVGTNRYKKANKTNDIFYNSFYSGNYQKAINNINSNMNLSTSSVNRKNLPKIKNQIEERKIPINKVVISAKNNKK